MSDLMPKGSVLNVDGVERTILFTLSVVETIQETYEKKFDDVLKDYIEMAGDKDKYLEWMKMTSGLLEIFANDDTISDDSKKVERGHFNAYITPRNINEICYHIFLQYGLDMPPIEEDDDPNRKSAEENP